MGCSKSRKWVGLIGAVILFTWGTQRAHGLDESSQDDRDLAEGTEETQITPISWESPLNFGVDLSYVTRKYENYLFSDTVASTNQPIAFRLNFEWIALQKYGKGAVGFSTGFSLLSNVFLGADVDNPENTDGIRANLYVVPVGLYVTYRADFLKNQILVPFGKVGGGVSFVKQTSSTGASRDGLQTFLGLEYGGGVELCLNPLEPSAARGFDQSLGVNTTYLVFEYLVASALNGETQPNLAGKEYRLGLRFEL